MSGSSLGTIGPQILTEPVLSCHLTESTMPMVTPVLSRCCSVFGAMLLLLCSQMSFALDASLLEPLGESSIIRLRDGSTLVGEVNDIRDGRLSVKAVFSETPISIGLEHIEGLTSSKSAALLLEDGRLITVSPLKVDRGQLQGAESGLALTAVKLLNPKAWERGQGYHWQGKVSSALAYSRGNTETDELDVALATVFTSVRNRYTFDGTIEQDYNYNTVVTTSGRSQQKTATADNWKLLLKYDHFLEDPRNYVGANVSVEADALADIDMRTYIGPYVGRKLFTDSRYQLDGELGFAFVKTEYDPEATKPNSNYTGMNWNFTGSSDILGGGSALYLKHVGIIDLQDAQQFILKTTAGLSFPLFFGLEGAAEVTVDYDGTAADDKEELDQVYKFRVGYTW